MLHVLGLTEEEIENVILEEFAEVEKSSNSHIQIEPITD